MQNSMVRGELQEVPQDHLRLERYGIEMKNAERQVLTSNEIPLSVERRPDMRRKTTWEY